MKISYLKTYDIIMAYIEWKKIISKLSLTEI